MNSQNKAQEMSRDPLLQRFPLWSLAHWCVVVFAAGFLLLAVLPEGRLNDVAVSFDAETIRVARSLLVHGAFADPFVVLKTGPTAHVAPAYPFLCLLVLRAFGTGYAALLILWAFNVALLALQGSFLVLVSYRFRLAVLPGVAAAILGAISVDVPIDTHWESFLTGTLLMAAFLLTERCGSGRRSCGWGLGLLWGLLALTNPVTVLLSAAWPACWLFKRPRGERAELAKSLALAAGVALLVVSPWIVRNHSRFGAFIFVRDDLGLELYSSNNSCAAPTLEENIQSGCHAHTHPNGGAAVAAELAAMGEYRFNQTKRREALAWIAGHRAAFAALTLRRFRQFWFPDLDRRWVEVLVWAISLLALPGLLAIGRKNRIAAWLVGVTWLLFPLIYYVVQSDPRYRCPIYWTSLLPAGCALVEAWGWLPFSGVPQADS